MHASANVPCVDIADAAALLDRRVAQAWATEGIPDVAYGLVLAGSLVHVGAVGSVERQPDVVDVAFRIASMTKSITAATVLRLRDEGLLGLDTRVSDVLPWAADIGLPLSSPALRIQHLLTMTAGLPTDDPWGDRQESLPLRDFDALVAAGLTWCRPPGIAFEYANLAYALLGRVVTAVTGADFTDVVREMMLEPLAMHRTTFDVGATHDRAMGWHPAGVGLREQVEGPPGAFSPMGGLWSTVGDMALWVAFMESAWADAPDDGPLSRWSRREMQRSHVFVALDARGVAEGYGMGLRVDHDPSIGLVVHHSGGYPGYGSHMRWHPDTRWGVVGLANRTYAPIRQACAQALAEIVTDEAADMRRQRAEDRLWPQTTQAMGLAESLLIRWDDDALDAVSAINLDLDQARDDRRRHWQQWGVGRVARAPGQVTSRSPAHACWRVDTDRGVIELEVLLTAERPPRIQSISAQGLRDTRADGSPGNPAGVDRVL